jgi:HEPN domain-containing protein
MPSTSFAPYKSERDKLDRYLNSFATQSFRDQADRDYISARLTCRYELFPQFLWSSQQAIEKYFKAILLYNRVKATKVGHDIRAAQQLTEGLPFKIELSERSREFIDLIANYGEFRYLEVPFHVYGHVLVDLDLTIWELRRYCQVLNVFGKVLPAEEQALLDEAQKRLATSGTEPRYKFRLHHGLLEGIMQSRMHPSRAALLWQNPCFGARKRSTTVKSHLNAQNPHLTHYPQMLEELLKYVYMPKKIVEAYRDHLAATLGEDAKSKKALAPPPKRALS